MKRRASARTQPLNRAYRRLKFWNCVPISCRMIPFRWWNPSAEADAARVAAEAEAEAALRRNRRNKHFLSGRIVMRNLLLPGVLFLVVAVAHAADVTVNWLDKSPPPVEMGISFGVPWPKGVLHTNDLQNSTLSQKILVQSWPMAYWPDGSIKWTGNATVAGPMDGGPLQLGPGVLPTSKPSLNLTCKSDDTGIDIDTSFLRCRIPKTGSSLIESLFVFDRKVAQDVKLIATEEDRMDFESKGILREIQFVSRIEIGR